VKKPPTANSTEVLAILIYARQVLEHTHAQHFWGGFKMYSFIFLRLIKPKAINF
jgi:hypothetical protein